ncbi:hypothetical protein ACIA8O_39885 [Kitasatospora sp. NPDC051853]|uniref:hypothetical protein n=1 Tax=Kitasatospora sp. NPDC051853 TaxID=3364058 RepID=UPI00379A909D
MNLFGRKNRNAPTYAQLGDAAQPMEHAPGAVVDDPRDVIPGGEYPEDEHTLGRFAWRLTGQPVRPDNRAASSGAAGTSTVAEHASVGEPDRRRQYDALTPAGYPTALPRMESSPLTVRAEPHGAVSIPGVTELTVNKAGGTSRDPAHEAGMPRYLWDRPFDSWATHHPLEVSKLGMPSPLAGNPITQSIPTAGGVPSPGGVAGVTAMEPDPIHRNTVRMMPTPWDESAVVGTDVQPVTGRRWRL